MITHLTHNVVIHRCNNLLMSVIHTRHGIGEHHWLKHQSDRQ